MSTATTATDKELNLVPMASSMNQMILGYRISQCIYVIAKLGIADLLGDGPKNSEKLAEACGAKPAALYRLLRFLTTHGIFVELDDGRFELTQLGSLLRTGAPWGFKTKALGIMHGEVGWRPWGDLLYSLQTGNIAFNHVFGMGVFEYLAQNPAEQKVWFDGGPTTDDSRAVAAACDFSGMKTVVDVGGAHGQLISAILKAHPHLNGILFDLPHSIERAKANIEAAGVTARCQLVSGSFLKSVPTADAYVLRSIIHDWDDSHCATILGNCRRAMNKNGKLFVVNRVMPDKVDESDLSRALCLGDLHMMVLCGGAQRTVAQFDALLAGAGFKLGKTTPAGSGLFIVFEALPT